MRLRPARAQPKKQLPCPYYIRPLRHPDAAVCHVRRGRQRRPLHTTPATIVRYTAWLGRLGTSFAASPQPYYSSSISKFLRENQRQPVAVEDMLTDAKRGPELRQQLLVDSDARVTLRAQATKNTLDWAHAKHKTPVCRLAYLGRLMRFRNALAMCTIYSFLLPRLTPF
jgi:hypothetical protein